MLYTYWKKLSYHLGRFWLLFRHLGNSVRWFWNHLWHCKKQCDVKHTALDTGLFTTTAHSNFSFVTQGNKTYVSSSCLLQNLFCSSSVLMGENYKFFTAQTLSLSNMPSLCTRRSFWGVGKNLRGEEGLFFSNVMQLNKSKMSSKPHLVSSVLLWCTVSSYSHTFITALHIWPSFPSLKDACYRESAANRCMNSLIKANKSHHKHYKRERKNRLLNAALQTFYIFSLLFAHKMFEVILR